MLRIPFKSFKFGFECYDPFRKFRIWIWMLRIPFECWNLQSIASHSFWILWIYIWNLPISLWGLELHLNPSNPFEWFEFGFECFESLSTGSKLHSNTLNLFRMVRICIQILRIPFEWFEFGFKCLESLSNSSNLHSHAWNLFRMVRNCIRMLWIFFEWLQLHFNASHPFQMLQFAFEPFQSRSNLHLNALNLFWMVSIRMLRILFEWFEFGSEYFSNG